MRGLNGMQSPEPQLDWYEEPFIGEEEEVNEQEVKYVSCIGCGRMFKLPEEQAGYDDHTC
jgi:hypothetical protein